MNRLNFRLVQQQAVRADARILNLPKDFKDFNTLVGNPLHPENMKPSPILDFQQEYFNTWMNHHKMILNKSRKIGATETALRIILYNILQGRYADHGVMIVAGNKQTIANKFITRLYNTVRRGFKDLNGNIWDVDDLITKRNADSLEWFNGCLVEAFPASDSVRGIENTICIFMSESAFIDLIDDRQVYNAVKPNIANITNADFILESTPNGRRGFFFDEFRAAQKKQNEFAWLEQPYTVALGSLLSRQFIENEKKNPKIDFEQEYGCQFTTSQSSAFGMKTIKWGDEDQEFTEY